MTVTLEYNSCHGKDSTFCWKIFQIWKYLGYWGYFDVFFKQAGDGDGPAQPTSIITYTLNTRKVETMILSNFGKLKYIMFPPLLGVS